MEDAGRILIIYSFWESYMESNIIKWWVEFWAKMPIRNNYSPPHFSSTAKFIFIKSFLVAKQRMQEYIKNYKY